MSQALYRKYRSRALADVVGQQHITSVLEQALAQQRTTHAYLFTGPRGVGKTSVARILAHEINKLPYSEDGHLDIVEIDAASNRRIDDIRELRDKVHIAPTSATYKVYIIDEVHMLTTESFNALLKTLEEPPAHVVFILATTEVQKLPATIVSRAQRYHFRPVSEAAVVEHLRYIATQENIAVDDDALTLIAQHGEGSFRDSISVLDQLGGITNGEPITAAYVETALGLAPQSQIASLADAALQGNTTQVTSLLGTLEGSGVSPTILATQLMRYLKNTSHNAADRFGLIDALLDVAKSHNPQLKLLAVLAQWAIDHAPRTPPKAQAAAVAAEPSVEAPIEELTASAPEADAAASESPPLTETPKAQASPNKPEADEVAEKSSPDSAALDWTQIMRDVTATHAPLASILKHATPAYGDDELTLYFPYELHRKKLDSTKYHSQLATIITNLYGSCPKIMTITGAPPPKNRTAASVVELMGGGEEVSLA